MLKISVVDDDASVRGAIDNLLSSHGYLVDTFVSAEAFLQSAVGLEVALVGMFRCRA
jgi:FixJ family two-component response regulator